MVIHCVPMWKVDGSVYVGVEPCHLIYENAEFRSETDTDAENSLNMKETSSRASIVWEMINELINEVNIYDQSVIQEHINRAEVIQEFCFEWKPSIKEANYLKINIA